MREHIILISAATTMASLVVSGPDMSMPRRMPGPSFYREPRTVMRDSPRQTKREKREMMQRDFERGGSRQGRRRRQRMYHCRNKE